MGPEALCFQFVRRSVRPGRSILRPDCRRLIQLQTEAKFYATSLEKGEGANHSSGGPRGVQGVQAPVFCLGALFRKEHFENMPLRFLAEQGAS